MPCTAATTRTPLTRLVDILKFQNCFANLVHLFVRHLGEHRQRQFLCCYSFRAWKVSRFSVQICIRRQEMYGMWIMNARLYSSSSERIHQLSAPHCHDGKDVV